jgi:hypothetical protein
MATYTPILGIEEVAPTQSAKETTINTATTILEAAANDSIGIDFGAGNVTATATEYTRYQMLVLGNATGNATLSVPDTKRANTYNNTSTFAITVEVVGGAGDAIIVPAGKIVTAQSDGVDVRATSSGVSKIQDLGDVDYSTPPTNDQILVYDSTSSKWVPTSSPTTFVGLSDVPGSYSGDATKLVRVNAAADALEFHTPVLADITDVSISSPTTGQSLVYNSVSGHWEAGIPVYVIAPLDINTYTGNVTLSAGDIGALVRLNSASPIALTIAPHADVALPLGQQFAVVARGTGLTSLVAGAGVTLDKPSDLTLNFRTQHSGVTLIQEAIDEWAVIGDLGT